MMLPVAGSPGIPTRAESGATRAAGESKREFAGLLGARLQDGLHFSKHAQARLASREIPLSEAQRVRLAEATDEAEKRGAREALLLMGNVGFIVSVPNRTVITALDGSRMEAGVITGIDAAVVVPDE
jgi:flagellar operon protein